MTAKDAAITWRHLASQTSGYGLAGKPGEAYAYNDFALALYYDTLTERVFGTDGTEVLRKRLGRNRCNSRIATPSMPSPEQPPGRLALSCRGLRPLRPARATARPLAGSQLIPARRGFVAMTNSLVPSGVPASQRQGSRHAPRTRKHRRARGTSHPSGPGSYSFNWWLNSNQIAAGHTFFVDAPPTRSRQAAHAGMRVLSSVPILDLIVPWNDSHIEESRQNPR